MTEDEAKTKWCPFTRVGEQASGAAENRPDGSYNCIASGCMAWRWAQKPNPDWKEQNGMMVSYPPRDTRYDEPMYVEDRTHGHCGAFGKIG